MIVALGSDHAGFALKAALVEHLTTRLGPENVLDLGPEAPERCDYPDYAAKVAHAIQTKEADFGVLVCGTGIGISIAANKHPGVRAALVHDVTTARLARNHNDAQIVCVGSRVLGDVVAIEAVDAFIEAEFEGGRHADRIAKIHAPETP